MTQQQAERSITLKNEQLIGLEAIINDIPTRYGIPLFQFLNSVAQQNAPHGIPQKEEEDNVISINATTTGE